MHHFEEMCIALLFKDHYSLCSSALSPYAIIIHSVTDKSYKAYLNIHKTKMKKQKATKRKYSLIPKIYTLTQGHKLFKTLMQSTILLRWTFTFTCTAQTNI